MRKFLIIFFLLSLANIHGIIAQELQAKVTINASRVNTTIDKKIFNTFQSQLTNFLNSRKWTDDQFNPAEKIVCSFLFNIESMPQTNVFSASLIIQAARPVYNSTYQAALVNFQDPDVTFKYIEFQPIEFSDSRVQGNDPLVANLTAVLAYYSYLIIGLDYDSFSPKAGQPYFLKAQNIVNNAPEDASISGWRAFDGLRNRYWLVDNLTNNANNVLHTVIYDYYRLGLDNMYSNEQQARSGILQALILLQSFNREHPNTMFVQFFMQTKVQELIGLFVKANADDKLKALDVFTNLDVGNATKYKEQLQ
ncbi:DUF4835 family protein [Hydrotalea sp.]|uniref:type IX secretion system protein PorD n=1 Tax=Hydrotalea sp. TaxID=2881279 RepID=UPI00262D7015|nr:DUF4835 family protein [Hydrotalea sp.]